MFKRAYIVSLIFLLPLVGCGLPSYIPEKPPLDTITNFKKPSEGMAGIYVYQWKSGVFGAVFDVDFEIKGQPTISLNTGEYGYLELQPGIYEVKFTGKPFPTFVPQKFEADQNYFYRAYVNMLSDNIVPATQQYEVDDVKENILSGRYEWYADD